MSSWLDEYLSALSLRDEREKANAETINAYTKLADHTAQLHKQHAQIQAQVAQDVEKRPSSTSRLPPSLLRGARSTPSPPPVDAAETNRLRIELASANRSIAGLISTLSTRDASLATLPSLQARLNALNAQKTNTERKLRDRESELKEKARLVESVQDELVAAEMAANVVEERAQRLEAENRDLVERWMKRKGKEADEMNKGSGWH